MITPETIGPILNHLYAARAAAIAQLGLVGDHGLHGRQVVTQIDAMIARTQRLALNRPVESRNRTQPGAQIDAPINDTSGLIQT
jgi:hypothetical protein